MIFMELFLVWNKGISVRTFTYFLFHRHEYKQCIQMNANLIISFFFRPVEIFQRNACINALVGTNTNIIFLS